MDEIGSHQKIRRDLLPGVHFFLEISSPGHKAIDPGLESVKVSTDFFNPERTAPAIIDQGFHENPFPCRIGFLAIQQDSRDNIMAIGENVGFHCDAFVHRSFDRKAAAVNFRLYAFNNHSFFVVF